MKNPPKLRSFALWAILFILAACDGMVKQENNQERNFRQPNILFAISDDQSYPHASAYGSQMVQTPAFDRIAKEGVLFNNAFAASPGCSPSRAALLTGMNCWQIEEAGTHGSSFPAKYKVYPDILEEAGYFVGYTAKGWAPGDWEVSGRTRNPAGDAFSEHQLVPPYTGIGKNDYAANFGDFLQKKPDGQPFCFWYGSVEPHRVFEAGSGLKDGKQLSDAEVPGFLPDTEEVRSDLLDYAVEIEWFDKQLAKMIALLEEMGELDNTIIVVTSDNGMAFPRAKANLYEHGFHVPLAIRWGDAVKAGQVVDELVSLIDLAPTYLDINGLDTGQMEGQSLLPFLLGEKGKIQRDGGFCIQGTAFQLPMGQPKLSTTLHPHFPIFVHMQFQTRTLACRGTSKV